MTSYVDEVDSTAVLLERARFAQIISDWCVANDIKFYDTLEDIGECSQNKIVKLNVLEILPGREELTSINDKLIKAGKHCWLLTDNILDTTFTDLSNLTVVFIRELIGLVPMITLGMPGNPTKKFNCFIQRVDSVRQTWLYFLHHHDLLDQGYVSFLLHQYDFYSSLSGVELFDWIHGHYDLGNLPHFQIAYENLRDRVPFSNFPQTGELAPLIHNSKYSLTLETYATHDDWDCWCTTEKTYRTLQTPTIGLYFHQRLSMTKLTELGFLIDPWMLRIDTLPWIERQKNLLDILVNDGIEYHAQTLYNKAMHNQEVIQTFRAQYHRGMFYDDIFSSVAAT